MNSLKVSDIFFFEIDIVEINAFVYSKTITIRFNLPTTIVFIKFKIHFERVWVDCVDCGEIVSMANWFQLP